MCIPKTCKTCGLSKDIDEYYRLFPKTDKPYRQSSCKSCMKASLTAYAKAHPKQTAERNKRYRERNKAAISERNTERCRAYRQRNLEKLREYEKGRTKDPLSAKEANKRWYEKNRDKAIAANKQHSAKNPEMRAARRARRRAAEKNATPIWANDFFIQEAYRLAKLREKVCGGRWNVDHIVPLQSRMVCGLHVESNLQVIPAKANREKSNVVWPQMFS